MYTLRPGFHGDGGSVTRVYGRGGVGAAHAPSTRSTETVLIGAGAVRIGGAEPVCEGCGSSETGRVHVRPGRCSRCSADGSAPTETGSGRWKPKRTQEYAHWQKKNKNLHMTDDSRLQNKSEVLDSSGKRGRGGFIN